MTLRVRLSTCNVPYLLKNSEQWRNVMRNILRLWSSQRLLTLTTRAFCCKMCKCVVKFTQQFCYYVWEPRFWKLWKWMYNDKTIVCHSLYLHALLPFCYTALIVQFFTINGQYVTWEASENFVECLQLSLKIIWT